MVAKDEKIEILFKNTMDDNPRLNAEETESVIFGEKQRALKENLVNQFKLQILPHLIAVLDEHNHGGTKEEREKLKANELFARMTELSKRRAAGRLSGMIELGYLLLVHTYSPTYATGRFKEQCLHSLKELVKKELEKNGIPLPDAHF